MATISTHSYKIVGYNGSTTTLSTLRVPYGTTYASQINNLYLLDIETQTTISGGVSNSVTYRTWTSFSDLISDGQINVIRTWSAGYSNTITLTTAYANSLTFMEDNTAIGHQFDVYVNSSKVANLKIIISVLLTLTKDDESVKIGASYTQSSSWVAKFLDTYYDASEGYSYANIAVNGSISSGTMTTAGDFTDSVSYIYDQGETVTGSRTVHVLDLTSIDLGQEEDYLITRTTSSVSVASCASTFTATYSDGTNTITETINTSSATETTAISATIADNESKTAVISYQPNQYATARTCNFYYVVTDSLQSVTLGGSYDTEYYTGDTFSFDGTATPTYASGLGILNQDTDVSVSSPDMSTAGTKTITVTFTDNDLNQSVTATYTIEVVKIGSISLSGQTTDFVYGDTAVYGSNVVATIYDSDGNETESGNLADMISAGTLVADTKVTNATALTSKTDVTLDGEIGQDTIKTTLASNSSVYFEYLVFISYCENFALSNTNLGTLYVDYNTATDLTDFLSDITAKYDFVSNTKAGGSSTTEISVARADLSTNINSITATSDITSQKVAFSYTTPETNQSFAKNVAFNVVINKFVSLDVSVSDQNATYYSGRTNTFAVPSLTIKKVYNNLELEDVDLTNDELATVVYRTSNDTSAATLTAGDSVSSNVTHIYVFASVDNGTGTTETLVGSFEIEYTTDTVQSVNFGTSFSFTLGNKMSKYKDNGDCVLIAHYASGYVTDTSDDIFTDYVFVTENGGTYTDTESVVTASGGTYYVKHNGTYYQVGYENGVTITYVVPTATISITGYQNTFVDSVDPIDFSNVTATITYADTDPSTTVTASLDAGNVPTASTYALSCTESDGGTISAFDGTEVFSITGISVRSTETISISALNKFDQTTITDSFTVSVVAISTLTIVRLVVRNQKTEYSVGESFLNSTDGAVVDLYYSGSTTPVTVTLKDVPNILATDPSQGTVFTKTNDSMTVTVRLLTDSTVYTTYTARVVSISATSTTETHNISTILIPNGSTTGVEYLDNNTHYYYDVSENVVASGWYILVDSNNTEIDANGARVLATGISLNAIKIYGYLEDIFNTGLAARVILFDDYVPPTEGEANIEVKFPCYVEGYADKINNCHIAKLFGNANAKNRLFVSGNPDYGNCDWHSGAVNEYVQQGETVDANGDFTYFGDMDYCFYGQTDNDIMGYDHVATDKMIVIKSKSKVEPTNYFRASTLATAIDASGNTVYSVDGSTLSTESFPLYTGNIGAGAMNFKSVANLNGDTLYLSAENTICGLNITGQVGDSQRISYSRSKYIDPELKELDLSDAVLWTNNEHLFLFASEATYMTHYETYDSKTGQYEWFKIDVANARCAIDIDGVIYIGSSDGSLYKFDKDVYYDCDKVFIEAGGALYVSLSTLFSDNKIVYSQDMNDEIDEDGEYYFSMKPASLQRSLFRKVASINYEEDEDVDLVIDYANNTLKLVALDSDGNFDAERAMVLQEELACDCKFYLNYADGESAIIGEQQSTLTTYYYAYTLSMVEGEEGIEYEMYDSDGNRVNLYDSDNLLRNLMSANLCRALDGQYLVVDLDKTDCSFKLYENGRELDIVRYGTQALGSVTFTSELHKHTPVKSYFVAAPAILGDLSYRKTIWGWTLSAFKEANDLQVCQANNEVSLERMTALASADVVPIGFNLGNLAFSQVDFGKMAVPRKYTYWRPLSVPFMAFGFKSDRAANSILTATSIVYTVPMAGRGNR